MKQKVYAERHPRVTLPSGATVTVQKKTDPKFPWEVAQDGKHFYLRRPRRGDSSTWQPYVGSNGETILFETERDALFLIGILDGLYRRFRAEPSADGAASSACTAMSPR